MEFFERAHVHKNVDTTSKKSTKSDEAVKKNLKQMLYGYKQDNTELIKNSATTVQDLDDSSSVSGFSDLNLTSSSDEDDSIELIPSSARSDDQTLSLGVNNSATEEFYSPRHQLSNIIEESYDEDLEESEPISQYEDNSDILGVTDPIEESELTLSSPFLSEMESDTDSNESVSEFDPDRTLAATILNKLSISKKDFKKQKYNEDSSDSEDDYASLDKELKKSQKTKKCLKKSKVTNKDKFKKKKKEIIESATESDNDLIDPMEYDNSNISEAVDSPPYISVAVSTMEDKTLEDILGDYRYSTTKNLPTDISESTMSMREVDLFSVEGLNTSRTKITEISDIDVAMADNEQILAQNEDETELDEGNLDSVDVDLDISTQTPQDESSMIYDTTQSEEHSLEHETTSDSNLVKPLQIFFTKTSCIIVLSHPLYIHGRIKIKSLGGLAEISGYTLTDNFTEIYAPYYDIAQCLTNKESDLSFYGLFGKLTSSGLSVHDAENIVIRLNEHDAVIVLQPLKSHKIDFVENNFSVTNLFSKDTKGVSSDLRKASEFLGCSLYLNRPLKALNEHPLWNNIVENGFVNNNTRGIICGGKGVGKSTFLRYYINKLRCQTPVLLIDLDPGQSEFTVAGSISVTLVEEPLLGPNFTHLKTPDRLWHIGMINTMENPTRYLNAVSELFTYCHATPRYADIPWIVNSMGMCNNMGLKFTIATILQLKPTFLLQIDSKVQKRRFEVQLDSETVTRLFYQYSSDWLLKNLNCSESLFYDFYTCSEGGTSGKGFSLAPRDERYLNYLAYFGELLDVHSGVGLLGILPYEVKLQDLKIGSNVKIPEDAVIQVLNGKIVALCQYRGDNKNKLFVLRDKPLLCHGHGLIRAIDCEKQIAYVITPVPSDVLCLVDTLVYADWVPELRGQESKLPKGTPVPYRTTSVYQQRQLMFSPRRRFNPLQLLKMSRNT